MFKTVTVLLRFVADVIASVLTIGPGVAESFVGRAVHVLKQGEEITVQAVIALQTAVIRMIEDCRTRLESAEAQHLKELRQERSLRARRDQQRGALYRVLFDLRSALDGAFGAGTAERLLGLGPRLGIVDAQVLRRHAREAEKVLTGQGFEWPGPALALTPAQVAAGILEVLEPLEQTLEELALQKRVTQMAQKAKTRALEGCRKTFVYGSRLVEALYVLAGEEFHAARLRPPVGSRSDATEPADPFPAPDPGEGEGEAPADEPPASEDGEPAGAAG